MDFEGAGRTLIQQTYDRFARFILPENIYVSTLESYVPLLQTQLPQLPREQILSEPVRRGTLAPITWATTLITQRDAEACIVVTPADQVIYLPKNAGKPIAWMGTVGLSDGTCPPSMGRSARDRILKNNGPEGHTDCTGEKATEYTGGNHVCYDYKTVDPRFPVKWCTFKGGHQWDMRENGKLWASDIGWEFITQF